MVIVAGTAEIADGEMGKVVELIREVVRITRTETGCISYTFYLDVDHPNTIHVFEEWDTEDDLNNHLGASHTMAFLGALPAHLGATPSITRYYVSSIAPL